MRKAMTVILWLGLAVCAILTISLSGQKSALQRDAKDAERKTEVLQALYDQKKSDHSENRIITQAVIKDETCDKKPYPLGTSRQYEINYAHQ